MAKKKPVGKKSSASIIYLFIFVLIVLASVTVLQQANTEVRQFAQMTTEETPTPTLPYVPDDTITPTLEATPTHTPTNTPTRTPTPTSTPSNTPEPTPTNTPSISPTPLLRCNVQCTYNSQCPTGLFCNNGQCRNPQCKEETDCACTVPTSVVYKSPTPTIKKTTTPTHTPTVKPTATPNPKFSPTPTPTTNPNFSPTPSEPDSVSGLVPTPTPVFEIDKEQPQKISVLDSVIQFIGNFFCRIFGC